LFDYYYFIFIFFYDNYRSLARLVAIHLPSLELLKSPETLPDLTEISVDISEGSAPDVRLQLPMQWGDASSSTSMSQEVSREESDEGGGLSLVGEMTMSAGATNKLPLGLVWLHVGTKAPTEGRELNNSKLSEALAAKVCVC
jgi:hypothetical protein